MALETQAIEIDSLKATPVRVFKNMSGKLKILRFNCNENNVNIEFSDLIVAQKLKIYREPKRKPSKKEKRLINSIAMKIMMFLN